MKVKVWIYIENLGDGSCCANFFSSEKEAEEYAKDHDERFSDDIYLKELEFSTVGELLNKDKK